MAAYVLLRSVHDTYISIQDGGIVLDEKPLAWLLSWNDDPTLSLRAPDGRYLCATEKDAMCLAKQPSSGHQWMFSTLPGLHGVQLTSTAYGTCVVAGSSESCRMSPAEEVHENSGQTWHVVPAGGAEAVVQGKVHLQSVHGTYLALSEDGHLLASKLASMQPCAWQLIWNEAQDWSLCLHDGRYLSAVNEQQLQVSANPLTGQNWKLCTGPDQKGFQLVSVQYGLVLVALEAGSCGLALESDETATNNPQCWRVVPASETEVPEVQTEQGGTRELKVRMEQDKAAEFKQRARTEAAQTMAKLHRLLGHQKFKMAMRQVRDQVVRSRMQRDIVGKDGFSAFFLGSGEVEQEDTLARLYAELLCELGVLKGSTLVQTTSTSLLNMSSPLSWLTQSLELLAASGGVLLVDDASQLTTDQTGKGRMILDLLQKAAKDCRRSMVVVLAGGAAEMKTLLSHAGTLSKQFPRTFTVQDRLNEDTGMRHNLERIEDKKHAGCTSSETTLKDSVDRAVADWTAVPGSFIPAVRAKQTATKKQDKEQP